MTTGIRRIIGLEEAETIMFIAKHPVGWEANILRFLSGICDVPAPELRFEFLLTAHGNFRAGVFTGITLDKDTGSTVRTIVHEFVHYLQWIDAGEDMDCAFPDAVMELPHEERPHEIEAYSVVAHVHDLMFQLVNQKEMV